MKFLLIQIVLNNLEIIGILFFFSSLIKHLFIFFFFILSNYDFSIKWTFSIFFQSNLSLTNKVVSSNDYWSAIKHHYTPVTRSLPLDFHKHNVRRLMRLSQSLNTFQSCHLLVVCRICGFNDQTHLNIYINNHRISLENQWRKK